MRVSSGKIDSQLAVCAWNPPKKARLVQWYMCLRFYVSILSKSRYLFSGGAGHLRMPCWEKKEEYFVEFFKRRLWVYVNLIVSSCCFRSIQEVFKSRRRVKKCKKINYAENTGKTWIITFFIQGTVWSFHLWLWEQLHHTWSSIEGSKGAIEVFVSSGNKQSAVNGWKLLKNLWLKIGVMMMQF